MAKPNYEKLEQKADEKLKRLQFLKAEMERTREEYLRESGYLQDAPKGDNTPTNFDMGPAIEAILATGRKRANQVVEEILKNHGFRPKKDNVKAMLRYLEEKGKVEKEAVSPRKVFYSLKQAQT